MNCNPPKVYFVFSFNLFLFSWLRLLQPDLFCSQFEPWLETLAVHLPSPFPPAAISPQDFSHGLCFLLLLPHMTNSASLFGFTVCTFLPPSALYKNQSCLILLWSRTLQRTWGYGPESHCTHNHVAPSGSSCSPSPGLRVTARIPLVPVVCLESPQPFLLSIPISKLMADS